MRYRSAKLPRKAFHLADFIDDGPTSGAFQFQICQERLKTFDIHTVFAHALATPDTGVRQSCPAAVQSNQFKALSYAPLSDFTGIKTHQRRCGNAFD